MALYSLGDAALLDRATAEVVGLLEQLGVLAPEREVLDIGCGIGRFVQALAAQVAAVVGIDIAPGMIAAAQQRCAGLSNVRLLLTSGRDLAGFGCASFDLVLAVDTVPYLYRTDLHLVETHVHRDGPRSAPGRRPRDPQSVLSGRPGPGSARRCGPGGAGGSRRSAQRHLGPPALGRAHLPPAPASLITEPWRSGPGLAAPAAACARRSADPGRPRGTCSVRGHAGSRRRGRPHASPARSHSRGAACPG